VVVVVGATVVEVVGGTVVVVVEVVGGMVGDVVGARVTPHSDLPMNRSPMAVGPSSRWWAA
jgi:hypothetical protein